MMLHSAAVTHNSHRPSQVCLNPFADAEMVIELPCAHVHEQCILVYELEAITLSIQAVTICVQLRARLPRWLHRTLVAAGAVLPAVPPPHLALHFLYHGYGQYEHTNPRSGRDAHINCRQRHRRWRGRRHQRGYRRRKPRWRRLGIARARGRHRRSRPTEPLE